MIRTTTTISTLMSTVASEAVKAPAAGRVEALPVGRREAPHPWAPVAGPRRPGAVLRWPAVAPLRREPSTISEDPDLEGTLTDPRVAISAGVAVVSIAILETIALLPAVTLMETAGTNRKPVLKLPFPKM